jgi:hypothetical protein
MSRGPRGFGFIVIAAIAIGIAVEPAGAAVVSGSNLAATPTSGICLSFFPGDRITCTTANSALPVASRAPGGARAGIDGVIVSWSIKTAASSESHSIGLRVVHGTTDGGAGPRETLPAAGGTYTYPARVPVHAADELGVDLFEVEQSSLPPVLRTSVPEALFDFWYPQLAQGDTRPPTSSVSEVELLMNATIEPDGDHDGYGDETQDLCPTVAGPGACPHAAPGPSAQPPPIRPDTAITKGPGGEVHSRNVSFAFRSDPPGAGFECKFDKRPFKACGSPRKYKNLGLGKHKFQVRAVNAVGMDSIPATRSFKIEP